jgi:serine/threonine kinase 32
LEAKECPSPFVPDSERPNFDVIHELDEFLMVEKPLTHSKRKTNPDLNKLKPELRELEEQFTLYDYTRSKRNSYYPHNQPISGDSPLNAPSDSMLPTTTVIQPSRSNTPLTRAPSSSTHL